MKKFDYREPCDYDVHFEHMKDFGFMKRINKYINDVIFKSERYLFVNKIKTTTRTVCSYCGHKKDLKKVPKQRSFIKCEVCKSNLEVRNTKFHSHADPTYADFIYFETSSVSKDIIIAYQFEVARTIEGSFEEIKVVDSIGNKARYYFEIGGTNRLMIYSRWKDEWDFAKSMYKLNSAQWFFMNYKDEQLLSVLKKSKAFKYFPKQLLGRCDGFFLLDLYAKHPNIELLVNMGLGELIEDRVNSRGGTLGTINWNGKTVQKMLKLNRDEIKLFVSKKTCSYIDLFAFQSIKKYGFNIEEEYEATINLINHMSSKQRLYNLMKLDKPSKIIKYLENQRKKAPKTYYSFGIVLNDFADMLDDMKALSILATKSNIYPKDLNRHHINLSAQIKQKNDEEQRQKVIARAKELSKFSTITGNFAIFPPSSIEDLVNESKKLNHCVSSYADRYANGERTLFFLREKDHIDEPLYTIEINSNLKLVQCRGKNNQNITGNEEANKALQAFLKKINRKKGSVTHERIAN